MPETNLIQILQTSVSPVVLISGIGLILLTLTNRFGRVVDRVRILSREIRSLPEADQKGARRQLRILFTRAKLLRISIFAASVSILMVALLILSLFVRFKLDLQIDLGITIIFSASILALVISMIVFLRDLALSLHALRLEIVDTTEGLQALTEKH